MHVDDRRDVQDAKTDGEDEDARAAGEEDPVRVMISGGNFNFCSDLLNLRCRLCVVAALDTVCVEF